MAKSLGRWILALDGSGLPGRELIGGKAWSIARMGRLGLNVPPSIVITTEACAAYMDNGDWPEGLGGELEKGLAWLEEQTGRTFGKGPNPLLVSVRSGAPISMPGMMDTILNLGINDVTESALSEECGDPAFAKDTHRRFIDLYASVVLKAVFDPLDAGKTPADWREVIKTAAGADVPVNVQEQLNTSVKAVFDSWNTRRAKRYRQHHNIPDSLGTAVVVQAMVFGNMNDQSGTGVLFTRNPLTGEQKPYGEYLPHAQGEDVVSGSHTPQPLEKMKETVSRAYEDLLAAAETLERENGDVQDIEFTIERGCLYLLQSRSAKRAPYAAARIAVDLAREGKIEPAEALDRVTPEQARTLLSPRLAEGAADRATVLAEGEGASPGVGVGMVVDDPDEAEKRAASGEAVILVRKTTSPHDIHGMISAKAIATEMGGTTSHAAVVGRALGRPCVVGCGEGSLLSLVGKTVTVDGGLGKLFAGELDVITPDERDDEIFSQLVDWAVDASPIKVVPDAPAGVDIVDLDGVEGIEDAEKLPGILSGLKGAKAIRLSTAMEDDAIAAALEAGIQMIVAKPTLPTLLAAVHARRRQQKA